MIGTAFDTKTVASARGLGKRFGDFVALDGIDFSLQENKIYGVESLQQLVVRSTTATKENAR
ncbi:hypothetical protein ACFVKB_14495 [Rhodococcus sp. NPDC127530]|jgi:hypothetical protein|uniref:hypothetical protein n=1 Tax=unclassified Rhodococcus (in: high G+C Gram-positive bacteria) TaxID=192944 RepID=UPI003626AA96